MNMLIIRTAACVCECVGVV